METEVRYSLGNDSGATRIFDTNLTNFVLVKIRVESVGAVCNRTFTGKVRLQTASTLYHLIDQYRISRICIFRSRNSCQKG